MNLYHFQNIELNNLKINLKIKRKSKNFILCDQKYYENIRDLMMLLGIYQNGNLIFKDQTISKNMILEDYNDEINIFRSKVGYLTSEPILINNLTIEQNIKLTKTTSIQNFEIDYFNFESIKIKRPTECNYYEKFITSVIRIYHQNPEIIIFDEPFEKLNENECKIIKKSLNQIFDFKNITIIYFKKFNIFFENLKKKNKIKDNFFQFDHFYLFHNNEINEYLYEK